MNTNSLVQQLLEATPAAADDQTENEIISADDGTAEIEDGSLEEAALLEFANGQEMLAEQMNIVRLNKQTRLLNLTNRSAIILAKRANDTLYAKYAKFNAMRLELRAQIVKKYGSRAASYARKIMARVTTAATAVKK